MLKKNLTYGAIAASILALAFIYFAPFDARPSSNLGQTLNKPVPLPIQVFSLERREIHSIEEALKATPLKTKTLKDAAFWHDALAIISFGINQYYPRPFWPRAEENVQTQLNTFLANRQSPGLPELRWMSDKIYGHAQGVLLAWAQTVHPNEWDDWGS